MDTDGVFIDVTVGERLETAARPRTAAKEVRTVIVSAA